MIFNSSFLALPFTIVHLPHPQFFLTSFHIFFVVLPQFCCSPSTIISFYHSVIPRVFCSFFNIPFSPSTIVSFFSFNYVFFFTVVVITQCCFSFPKNSIVFVHNIFFFFHKAIVLFPKLYCLLLQCYCHNSIIYILLLPCYFFIISILFFFHNSLLA